MVVWSCTKERINERGSYILVEWSCAKERMTEKGPYMLVEWSRANKRNKSIRITIPGQMAVLKRKNK